MGVGLTSTAGPLEASYTELEGANDLLRTKSLPSHKASSDELSTSGQFATGLSSTTRLTSSSERTRNTFWRAAGGCLYDVGLKTPLLLTTEEGLDVRCLNRRVRVFSPRRYAHLKRRETEKEFGVKTIGQIGSFVYLVNQIFGTGVIAIPNVFSASGWVPTLFADTFVCVAALLGTLMMLRCMTLVKGNRNFERRLEYMSVIKCYLADPLYRAIQSCFYLSILASNLVSVIVVAQAVDHLLAGFLGSTYSLTLYPDLSLQSFDSHTVTSMYSSSPGMPATFAISLGYVLTAACCIPLAQQTMEENMAIQYVSFLALIGTLLGLSLTAMATPSSSSQAPLRQLSLSAPPAAFGRKHYGELLSTFLASFSYVNVVPSWANEMTWDVHVGHAIWTASLFAFVVYYLFGFIMSAAYPQAESDNILQAVLELHSRGNARDGLLEQALVYAFDLITVAPGILVYCITTRYNLLNSKTCGRKQAFFWASVFPFLVAWLLSDNSKFSSLLSWSALVFSLTVNFIAPCLIFLVACCISRPSIRNPVINETRNAVQITLQEMGAWISAKCAAESALRSFASRGDSIASASDQLYEFHEVPHFRPGQIISAVMSDSVDSFKLNPSYPEPSPSASILLASDNCFVPWQPSYAASFLAVPNIYDQWASPSAGASPAFSLFGRQQGESPLGQRSTVGGFSAGLREHVGVKRSSPPHDLNALPTKLSRLFIWDTIACRRRAVLLAKQPAVTELACTRKTNGRRRAHSSVSRAGLYAPNASSTSMAMSGRLFNRFAPGNLNLSWGHALRPLAATTRNVSAEEDEEARFPQSCFIVVQAPGTAPKSAKPPTSSASSSEAADGLEDIMTDMHPFQPRPDGNRADESFSSGVTLSVSKLMLPYLSRHAPATPTGDPWTPFPLLESLDGSSLAFTDSLTFTSGKRSLYQAQKSLTFEKVGRTDTTSRHTLLEGQRKAYSARHSLETTDDRHFDLSPLRSVSARRAVRRRPAGCSFRSAHKSRNVSNTRTLLDSVEVAEKALEVVVTSEDDEKTAVKGAEDAYEQDEDIFGEVDAIRIRVFPAGWMRKNHIEITVVLLCLLVCSCLITATSKLYTDVFLQQ